MKKLLTSIFILLTFFLLSGIGEFVEAKVKVRGYFKPSTGKWIEPHFRSSPNQYRWDNWSSWGNINPYTGKRGYRTYQEPSWRSLRNW